MPVPASYLGIGDAEYGILALNGRLEVGFGSVTFQIMFLIRFFRQL